MGHSLVRGYYATINSLDFLRERRDTEANSSFQESGSVLLANWIWTYIVLEDVMKYFIVYQLDYCGHLVSYL